MIKKLIAFLLLNRVAVSIGIKHEDKSSDVDAYSLYDSMKLSNLEAQTSFINANKKKGKGSRPHSLSYVGANDGRKYINRMLKSFKSSKATDTSTSDTKDEGIAELLLESGLKIGLVQAKMMTALTDYKKDIQKNMIKELVKRGVYDPTTNTYKEFDTEEIQQELSDGGSSESSVYTSSDSNSDSNGDSDDDSQQ